MGQLDLVKELWRITKRLSEGDKTTYMEYNLETLAIFMEQHRANPGGRGATKALKGVVDKIGRFDGKSITNFLRVYVYEMEVHQVQEYHMMQTFDLVVVPKNLEKIREIWKNVNMIS